MLRKYFSRVFLQTLIYATIVYCVPSSIVMAGTCRWVTVSTVCSTDPDPHGAFCNEYQCYWGPYYYSSSTVRKRWYQLPGYADVCRKTPYMRLESTEEWQCQCSLKISDFHGPSQAIKPGEGALLSGNIYNSSSETINWTISLPNGQHIIGAGKVPSAAWNGKDADGNTAPDGSYTAVLNAKTADGNCSDEMSAQIIVKSSCDLNISNDKQTIRPYAGGGINITGTVTDSSDHPISWEITLPNGEKKEGSGTTPSATWDGKDKDGKIVDADSYVATITARSSETCSKSVDVPITVMPVSDTNSCALQVRVGSSANVANGNLSHSQELFSTKGGALPLSMTLYYNSLDPFNGSLGRGWSHSFDNTLVQNSHGSVLLKEGNWRRRLYTLSNGSYISQPGDYGTLVKNPDNTFTLTEKEGTIYNYDTDGKIVSITGQNGNTVTFAYSVGNIITITDPAGHSAALSYDGDNHLTLITDPSGNSYFFTYSNGTLATVNYPGGGVWRYTYDDKAFMLAKTDPLGNTTRYAYDDSHRTISSTDPEGRTRTITYPAGSDRVKTTTFTEKDGGVWSYTYNTLAGTLMGMTDPLGDVTSYTYDASGNRLSTTAPDGTTTSSNYDDQGNMTSKTDALGQITSYTYNVFGNVMSIKDPQGNSTGYEYDAAGNMTGMTDSTGATTTYVYDTKGNVTKVTNAADQATFITYDSSGNLVSVTDPSGVTTGFTYDAAGNMITQTVASGETTRFDYNAKNQLVKMTDSNGNFTTNAYDLVGNRVSVTDANGNTTLYEYNANGQVVKGTDALDNATTYTYGATGCPACGGGVDKLTALADANGNSTTFQYDTLGRMISETDTLGNISNYAYDANGNLTSKTDANGNTVQYRYDGLGRLLKKSYPDNTEETFTYDAMGNILTASNSSISFTMTYDALGRMLTSTDSSGRSVSYEYDILGNRTKMTSPEGKAVTYRYDDANRLTTMTNGGMFNFTYDRLGRRTKLLYPNGTTANYGYDGIGRLTSLAHKTGKGSIIDSFAYTHDKVGNRLTRSEPDVKTIYSYDKLYRLLQATPVKRSHWRPGKEGESYTYDPVGNRLTGPDPNSGYFYNEANQLMEETGQRTRQFPGIWHPGHAAKEKAEYSYDRNGNLIRKAVTDGRQQETVTLYTYDFENRLIRVDIQKGHQEKVVTFSYDPFGRRLSKTVEREEIGDNDDNGRYGRGNHVPRTTLYIYDSEDIIMEYDERGRVVSRYVHGPGIDEPLALYKERETYYYHADGLGSITALTDKRGHVEQRYDYNSFGNLTQDGDNLDQPYTYTGREWDKETGLYYYRARYYDPMEGRFIGKDPLGIYSNRYNNQYMYVENNAINKTDPTGLYGDDVHFGLTYQLALDAKLPPEVTYQLAKANQSVDTNFWTSPVNPITGTIFHFQTSKYAAVGLEQSLASGDIDQFGKFLHIMQDTFSHKGFSVPIGHLLSNMGTKYSYKETDRYSCTNPRDIYMRKETEYWLQRFKERFIGGVK
jgi:RHS repeat-associated protein